MKVDLAQFEREFLGDPVLLDRTLSTQRAAPMESGELIIRCSRQNADHAIARALAKAVFHGELCRVEVEGDSDV